MDFSAVGHQPSSAQASLGVVEAILVRSLSLERNIDGACARLNRLLCWSDADRSGDVWPLVPRSRSLARRDGVELDRRGRARVQAVADAVHPALPGAVRTRADCWFERQASMTRESSCRRSRIGRHSPAASIPTGVNFRTPSTTRCAGNTSVARTARTARSQLMAAGIFAITLISKSKPASQVTPTAVQFGYGASPNAFLRTPITASSCLGGSV